MLQMADIIFGHILKLFFMLFFDMIENSSFNFFQFISSSHKVTLEP